MNTFNSKTDFSSLLSPLQKKTLLQHLIELTHNIEKDNHFKNNHFKDNHFKELKNDWYKLSVSQNSSNLNQSANNSEQAATDWLILLFNTVFADQKVILVRSEGEPEYFPAQNDECARIEFAHGFFASALHEISHWCLAGEARRRLPDFGYWYAPDGRSAAQQQAFERVEVKPQALECLFTLACGQSFQVSQDNLFAEFDTSSSTFESDVYQQAEEYILKPHTLPRDAKILLCTLLMTCTFNHPTPMVT